MDRIQLIPPVILTGLVILLSGGILAGCGLNEAGQAPPGKTESSASGAGEKQAAVAGAENALAGTEWQLVEIQSMDDAAGMVRPKDPSLFTLRLDRDGTATLRLDCNRARGTWSAEPSADGRSGRFAFGPLAATRAVCPPPNLDERILAQVEAIRGYLLKEGRLYLTLMADGGIYAWAPHMAEVPFETLPDADLEAAILRASPSYTREIVAIGGQEARYLYGRVDLNGDGRKEVFAYLLGSIFCGTGGCNLLLFTPVEGGYALVNDFPISRLPVIVSEVRTTGWNDIIRLESGGGAPASYVRHTFDGTKYVEEARLPADQPPSGTRILPGEFVFQDGFPLKPGN